MATRQRNAKSKQNEIILHHFNFIENQQGTIWSLENNFCYFSLGGKSKSHRTIVLFVS